MTGVTRQLVNAGFDYEDIPRQWVEVIVAGSLKYFTGTREGLDGIVHRLRLERYRGKSEEIYEVVNDEETQVEALDGDDVVFVRGVFAQGRPISLKQLAISEKERKQCEDCRIVAHCTVDVRDPRSGRLETRCNGCVIHNESPKINGLGSPKICEGCTVVTCAHHPLKEKHRARA